LSADCKPGVTITASSDPPYEAGDVLTCAASGSSPAYVWSGQNGGNTFSSSTPTVTLLAGEFCLSCTATLNSDPDCSTTKELCGSAYSKYRKQRLYSCNTAYIDDTFCRIGGLLLLP